MEKVMLRKILQELFDRAQKYPTKSFRRTLSHGLIIFMRFDEDGLYIVVVRKDEVASRKEYEIVMSNMPIKTNGAIPVGYDHAPYHGFMVIIRMEEI
jgi:hypothetical protein